MLPKHVCDILLIAFQVAAKYGLDWFKELVITASNDINEETILSLNEQGHKITAFGIGTIS